MMEFNQKVIDSIIKDVDKSIELHRLIPVLYPHCTCNASKDNKCFKCKSLEAIDDLDCLISHLKPLNRNTIHHVQWIDVESFCYSLGKTGQINSIEIQPIFNGPNPEHPNSEPPIGFTIHVTPTSRFAMDGNGFHVGYETVTYEWKAYSKHELGIAGLPYLLSSWVVNPNEYEIINKDLPDEEEPIHSDDCEAYNNADWIVRMYDGELELSSWTIDGNRTESQAYSEAESEVLKHKQSKYTDWTLTRDDSFDNCDCAEFWNGYYPPDDDFFYQEIQSILEWADWVEAEFDPDTREWTLGYTSFNVNEYQTNSNYADSCNQDNGMPSFGTYC